MNERSLEPTGVGHFSRMRKQKVWKDISKLEFEHVFLEYIQLIQTYKLFSVHIYMHADLFILQSSHSHLPDICFDILLW